MDQYGRDACENEAEEFNQSLLAKLTTMSDCYSRPDVVPSNIGASIGPFGQLIILQASCPSLRRNSYTTSEMRKIYRRDTCSFWNKSTARDAASLRWRRDRRVGEFRQGLEQRRGLGRETDRGDAVAIDQRLLCFLQ